MKSVSTVETLNVEEVQKCKNMGEKCTYEYLIW
jgi:hypothetical protein